MKRGWRVRGGALDVWSHRGRVQFGFANGPGMQCLQVRTRRLVALVRSRVCVPSRIRVSRVSRLLGAVVESCRAGTVM